jgi:sulfate/thiosulfate transport system ATP-binding protein
MSIVLDRLTKRFGNQLVVDHVSLEVGDGELFVMLGASGSGKSTILRLIAGLAKPDGGNIHLNGRDVTELPPQERGTGFVFQNYSLFRHMTVAENIEFGLRVRKTPFASRGRRRDELLDLVGLSGLGNRYPHQLSGGQQQRVALARALAYEPNVLLLDEPFGALDVKIRNQLRRSLKSIQKQLGVTTILVTHDQEEAFELADRIGVIERGHLLEVGPSEVLYSEPKSLFVSTFLGAGTVLVGRAEDGRAIFGPISLPIPPEVAHDLGAPVQMLFRPEQVLLTRDKPTDISVVLGKGKIVERSFTGTLRRVRVKLPRLPSTRQIAPAVPFGEESLLVDAVLPAASPVKDGELWVSLNGWHILQQPPLRLLACDSGAGSESLLNVTRAVADRLKASVTLLGVARSEEASKELGSTLMRRQEEAGLAAQLKLRYGEPAEQIANEQADSLYDLLLVQPGARPKAARLRVREARGWRRHLGSTLAGLLERAELPVLIVKGDRTEFTKVLICTAAGEPGKRDVRIGGRLARLLGAAVTLLYVTRMDTEPGPLARTHLNRAVTTLRAIDVPCELRVRSSARPSEGILEEARSGDHDLIVLGSHVPRARVLFQPSDVTLEVIGAADRPVLVIPPTAV